MSIVIPVAVIAVAFFGESVFGFGGGLIAIPLLGIILGVREAVTLVLIFQLLMGLLIIRTHKYTDWSVANPMTPGLVVGTVIGTFLLSLVSKEFLLVFLAVAIFLFLAKSLFFNGFTVGTVRNKLSTILAGLLGGLFQGLIGTGGPVLTMYLSVAVQEKVRIRATLIYLFFLTSIIRVVISLWQGLFSLDLAKLALVALPFFVVAIVCGQTLHAKVSERHYKIAINVILFISAISLLVKVL